MNFVIILLVFSLVGCLQVSGQNSDDAAGSSKAISDPSRVCLPTYVLYIVGFTVLVLVLAIVYLTYALIKLKCHQYKIMNDVSLPAYVQVDKSNQNTYNRQQSTDAPTLCNPTVVTPIDEIIIEDSFFEKATSSRNLVDDEASIPKHRSKILPIIKKSVNSQFILPEDKMKEICIGVLKNRRSIKDVNEFVSLIEKRPGGNKSGLARERSASTSVLDNLTYDTHQTQGSSNKRNIKNDQGSTNKQESKNNQDTAHNQKDTNNQEEKEKITLVKNISNEISVENDDETDYNTHTDEIYDCPPLPKEPVPKKIPNAESDNDCDGDIEQDEIYDCLPVPKEVDGNKVAGIGDDEDDAINTSSSNSSTSKKIIIEDTEYLFVIDPAIDEFKKEPSYINANKNDFNLN